MPTTVDRIRSRWSASLVLAVALGAAIAAQPTFARAQAAKAPAGELRWALHVTLAARWLDPAMPEGLITPSLAESWTEAKDHPSYTFVLRKGEDLKLK